MKIHLFKLDTTAFEKYVALLPFDGLLVLNADDANCLKLRSPIKQIPVESFLVAVIKSFSKAYFFKSFTH